MNTIPNAAAQILAAAEKTPATEAKTPVAYFMLTESVVNNQRLVEVYAGGDEAVCVPVPEGVSSEQFSQEIENKLWDLVRGLDGAFSTLD